jgi:hypothetical protein
MTTIVDRIVELTRALELEQARADAYRRLLVRIADSESGQWGVIVRQGLREIDE